jgi:polar amino acid transport system substrate-binding protein
MGEADMRRRFVLSILMVALVLSAAIFGLIELFQLGRTTEDATDTDRPLLWGIDIEGGRPYLFRDPNNPNTDTSDPRAFVGFEVDLVLALEKELGRKIKIKNCDFSNLVESLTRGQKGDFDFAMNGLEITPDRMRQVLFCRPYYIYKLQLIIREDEERFTNLLECKDNHFVIGTMSATAAAKLLVKWNIPRNDAYDNQDIPFTDLLLKRIDGVLFDLPIALYYAKADAPNKYARPHKGLKLTGEPLEQGYYGIAVRKDNPKLKAAIDSALDRMLKNGELRRIYEKWDLWNDDQDKLVLSSVADIQSDTTERGFEWYFPLLLEGAEVTVIITVASMALAVLVGLFVALARMYGGPVLSRLALVYVEFFRGIPALFLLYFLYFGLPAIARYYNLPWDLDLSPWTAAILGLGLNYAAYEAEIYRAAIKAIPQGQWEAAASLGMSGPLTFRRIILPQAIRGILPPMTNDFVALFKDTSLVSVIAVIELNKQYQILTKSGGDYLQIGLATALLYLIMSVPLGLLSRHLEKRWGRRD